MIDKDLIVVNYQPFCRNSEYFILKNSEMIAQGDISSNIAFLSNELIHLAYTEKIYTIDLSPRHFLNEIEKKVNEEERKIYSASKIKFKKEKEEL